MCVFLIRYTQLLKINSVSFYIMTGGWVPRRRIPIIGVHTGHRTVTERTDFFVVGATFLYMDTWILLMHNACVLIYSNFWSHTSHNTQHHKNSNNNKVMKINNKFQFFLRTCYRTY